MTVAPAARAWLTERLGLRAGDGWPAGGLLPRGAALVWRPDAQRCATLPAAPRARRDGAGGVLLPPHGAAAVRTSWPVLRRRARRLAAASSRWVTRVM